MLPAETEADLARQKVALTERVNASGLYTHEPEEFDIAIRAYRRLSERLALTSDVRSLTTPESRNIVRLVTTATGEPAVLKIMGNGREPGEGEVLRSWHKRGLPCVTPIDWGYETILVDGVKRVASYLLTAYVDGEPLRHRPEDPLDEKEHQLEILIRFIEPFHSAALAVSTARSWSDRMWLHLKWVTPLIEEAGLNTPTDWRVKLKTVSDRGRILIHGDPAGANVVRSSSGPVLLDPPGALLACREADVAQICCQVGGASLVPQMITKACDLDRTLHPEMLACLAGINILLWAGYLLVGHAHPDIATDRSSERERQVTEAVNYMYLAGTLLDSFELS